MPDSNPSTIQVQSQPKPNTGSQVKELAVPKRTYSIIRSIVDSSPNPRNYWNQPIIVGSNKVKFAKYKALKNGVELKAWEIVVEPNSQGAETELDATVISVLDSVGRLVADLIIRSEPIYKPRKTYTLTIIRSPDNIEVSAGSIHEFEYYVAVPSESMRYAEPVPLARFVNKLMLFYRRAVEALRG